MRGFAAVYVATGHFVLSDLPLPSLLKLPFRFGQEAVMLFFILSGFVIAVSITKGSAKTARSYYVRRFRRIYPLVFITFCISILVNVINAGVIARFFSLNELFGNVFMLQDWNYAKPGVWFGTFLGNDPLWSLSYEWWFYILGYPILTKLGNNRRRVWIVLAFSLISWTSFVVVPNHISLIGAYLIVWWAGIEVGILLTSPAGYSVTSLRVVLLSLIVMVIASALPLVASRGIDMNGGHDLGIYPYLTMRHFLMAVCSLAAAIIWRRARFKFFDKSVGLFAVFAPVAYGIYLFHFPLLVQLNLDSYVPVKLVALGLQLGAVALMAYLAEVRLQPLVNRVLQ